MYVTVQEKNKLQVYSSANIKALKNYLLSQKPCLIFYRPFTYAYRLFGITPGSMIKLRSQNISSNSFHKN